MSQTRPGTLNVERVRDAYQVLAGVPSSRTELSMYMQGKRDVHNCGSMFCGAGWLAMHPGFPEISLYGMGWIGASRTQSLSTPQISTALFGVPSYVFDMRGYCMYDSECFSLSDKEMLLYRLRRLLGQPRSLQTKADAIKDAKCGEPS